MAHRTILFIVITFFITLTAYTGSYAGFDNTTGARGEGIGFSYSVLAEGPFGALYNPAGPAFVKGWQTQFQYYRPTAYGLPSLTESPYGGLAGLNYFNEKFGNVVLNAHQFGSFSNPTGVTTSSTINLAYARQLYNKISFGGGIKYLFETNLSKRKTFDLDLGFCWRSRHNFSLAGVGENLLRSKLTSSLTSITEHLSRKFRLAGAYHIPMTSNTGSLLAGWQLEQSGEQSSSNTSEFNFGSEWWIGTTSNITFGLRAGYTLGKTTISNTKTDFNRWNAGFSLNFDMKGRDIRIDYAIRSYPFESTETLPSDNFVSITYGWGGVPDYYTQKEEKKYDLAKYHIDKPSPVTPPPTFAPTPTPSTPDMQITQIGPPQPAITDELTVAPVQDDTQLNQQGFSPVDQPAEPTTLDEITHPATPEPVTPPVIPAQPMTFEKLDLELDFTLLSTGNKSQLIFYLRPQGLMRINSWKLYIFTAKLKNWNDESVDNFAHHVIEGKGITPLTVVWDGLLANGELLKPGKYFFVVLGKDKYGNRYMTKWEKFKYN